MLKYYKNLINIVSINQIINYYLINKMILNNKLFNKKFRNFK